ncbi:MULTISPECIES: hypothetical protein [unclassified Clostridium]|uniref:hypothetical protein n=1 Tax=unclassified Clostridium TaxID=2614128 RepID=UPI0025C0E793|nr:MULTISPECIES: hypothetical protein [unclassified Clostridium]
MFKLVRTKKKITFESNCLYDDMYKSAIYYLSSCNNRIFKYKTEIYNLLDKHIRNSGICNPEIHLGKGNQTSKTLFNKLIKDGFVKLENKIK